MASVSWISSQGCMIHSLKFSETLACRCCLSRNTIAVLLISFPPACRPSFAKAFAGQSVRPTCGSMLNISLGVCRPHQSSHRPVCFMTLQGVYHRGQVVCVVFEIQWSTANAILLRYGPFYAHRQGLGANQTGRLPRVEDVHKRVTKGCAGHQTLPEEDMCMVRFPCVTR